VSQAEWHKYQSQTAAIFAALGCSVSVDTEVRGARAVHRIDVLVRFSRWGLPQIWVVECKHQRRRVTKSAVEALKSIVLDTGADRGFLISENGFQPAAIAAANLTNISLLSLSKLEAGSASDVKEHLLARLEFETLSLLKLVKGLQVELERSESGGLSVTYGLKPGVDRFAMSGVGSLMFLVSAMQGARIGEFGNVVPRSFPNKTKRYVNLPNAEAVIAEGFRLVSEVRVWLLRQEVRMRRAERWLARPQGLEAGLPPDAS